MAESLQPTKFEKRVINETAVDYGAFATSFATAIESGLTARTNMLDSINKSQDEFNKQVRENQELAAQSGDMIIPRVTKAMEEGSLMLQETNNLYRRGKMTRDQWLNKTNKINNSATQMKAFITEFNTQYKESIERQKAGTLEGSKVLSQGSTLDAYNMEGLGAIAQMKNHGFQFTENGDLLFAKFDENGNASKKFGDYKTLPGSLAAVVQKYDNVDMNSVYDTTADGLKPFITVDTKGRYIKTFEQVLAEENEEAKNYIDAEWQTVKNNDDAILSLITDQGVPAPDGMPAGTQYDYTEDKAEADANKNLILVESDQDGRLLPIRDHENFIEASKKAETTFYNGVKSRLGYKETVKEKDRGPAMQQWQYKAGQQKEQQKSNLNLINKLFSSDEGGYNEAVNALKGFVVVTGEGGEKKEVSLDKLTRGKDGIVRMEKEIVTIDENGKKTTETKKNQIDMSGMNNREFMNAYFSFMYGSAAPKSVVDSYRQVESYGASNKDYVSKTTKLNSTPYSEIGLVELSGTKVSPDIAFKNPIDTDNITKVIDSYSSIVSGGLDADLDFTGYEYVETDAKGVPKETPEIQFGYQGNRYLFPLTEEDGEFKIQGGNFQALYKQMARGEELKGNYVTKL